MRKQFNFSARVVARSCDPDGYTEVSHGQAVALAVAMDQA